MHDTRARPGGRRAALLRLAGFLAAGGAVSVSYGQDANWDLANYHFYNAYAFLHGRIARDLLPADVQTGICPALDLIYYALAAGPLAHWPRVLAFVQGVWFGLLLEAVLQLARLTLGARGPVLCWLAVAMAATAGVTRASIGSTHNDIPVAAMLLWGLVAALGASGDRSVRRWPVAGALWGVAIGCKLTALVFAPGALAAVLIVQPGWRGRAVALLWAGAGMAGGLAVVAGPSWWQWYGHFGNPVFPMMNSLFRSGWYPPQDARDLATLPQSAAQALLLPFWMLTRHPGVPGFGICDARFALAVIAAAILAVRRRAVAEGRRMCALLAFFAVGFPLWEAAFAVVRYAIVLESLAAIPVTAALAALLPARWRFGPEIASAAVLAGLLIHTVPPAYYHVPFEESVFRFAVPDLPPGSMVLVGEPPVAIVLPFLAPSGPRIVGVTRATLAAKGFKLFDAARAAIAGHRGPMFLLTAALGDAARDAEQAFGFTIVRQDCQPIQSNIAPPGRMQFCPVRPGAD